MNINYTINGSPVSPALYAGGAETAEELKEAYKKYVTIEKIKATKRKNKEIK
jgi:hypothetical protein